MSVAWDFGDGATGAGATVTHTYASPGDFTVEATAGDQTATTAVTVPHAAPIYVALVSPVSGGFVAVSDVWPNAQVPQGDATWVIVAIEPIPASVDDAWLTGRSLGDPSVLPEVDRGLLLVGEPAADPGMRTRLQLGSVSLSSALQAMMSVGPHVLTVTLFAGPDTEMGTASVPFTVVALP